MTDWNMKRPAPGQDAGHTNGATNSQEANRVYRGIAAKALPNIALRCDPVVGGNIARFVSERWENRLDLPEVRLWLGQHGAGWDWTICFYPEKEEAVLLLASFAQRYPDRDIYIGTAEHVARMCESPHTVMATFGVVAMGDHGWVSVSDRLPMNPGVEIGSILPHVPEPIRHHLRLNAWARALARKGVRLAMWPWTMSA